MQPVPSGAEEALPPVLPDAASAEPEPGGDADAGEGASGLAETSGAEPSDGAAAAGPEPAPGLGGDELPDEVTLKICSFLGVRELGRLGCVSQRFAEKSIAAPGGGGEPAAATPERLSLAEETARRWVAGCSEQERGWVSWCGTESWLGLMHEVGLLRLPLLFGRDADITLSENGALATGGGGGSFATRTAASKAAMRSGRHFAQFTVVQGRFMYFGVIRQGWDPRGGEGVYNVDGHCFYRTGDGARFPGRISWEGGQAAKAGDRIGILLDLDQGSMTVWKNGEQLGVMQAEGLTGPLCWAVLLNSGSRGDSARIESAPAPDE